MGKGTHVCVCVYVSARVSLRGLGRHNRLISLLLVRLFVGNLAGLSSVLRQRVFCIDCDEEVSGRNRIKRDTSLALTDV